MLMYRNNQSLPWVDEKYAMLLSQVTDRFVVTSNSPLTVNFRCPVCGDSNKSKRKARGYVFRTPDGSFRYKCHNCDASSTLRYFLKSNFPSMYRDYVADTTFDAASEPDRPPLKSDECEKSDDFGKVGLPSLAELPSDHPAVAYWVSRKLPVDRMADAYWTPAFFAWVNDTKLPGKFASGHLSRDHGRIVIPWRDESGEAVGYTARSLDGEQPKYYTVKRDDGLPPFGCDRVDPKREVVVVEGPFDSMLLENAVAMGTSNKSVSYNDAVYVYDNEPRNPNIVQIVKRAIASGKRVVVWPPDFPYKDVNDMHLDGVRVQELIRDRTFRGARALVEVAAWSKS